MEVLNLAVVALFEALSKNNIDKARLLEGTGLELAEVLKVKKKHSWNQFVKMYENCAMLLGPEKAAREIAYHGMFNENMSHLRKIATGVIDVKAGYWYLAQYGSKHLFKNTIDFTYSKISSKEILIRLKIDPKLQQCPLLFETYAYFYENAPTLFGLPKASVSLEVKGNSAKYSINFVRTMYFGRLFSLLHNYFKGYKTTIQLLSEVEKQSVELSKLLEEKSQLLRMLSHDIANQLLYIDFNISKILKRNSLQPDDLASFENIHKSTSRLSQMLSEARNIEITHIKGIEIEPVDLNEIFSSLSEYFKNKLEEKNITLSVKNNLPEGVEPKAEQGGVKNLV